MQKSGTSWLCNMLVDLVAEIPDQNTRDIRARYGLEGTLAPYYTPTLRKKLTADVLKGLCGVAREAGSIVFKTHRPPFKEFAEFQRKHRIKVIYLYRDPRDVICSALDHGAKERSAGRLPIRGFARLTDFNRAMRWYRRTVLPTALKWLAVDDVIEARYEDLVLDVESTLRCLLKTLDLKCSDGHISKVVADYSVESVKNDGEISTALHFNKAIVGRHRELLSEAQEQSIVDVVGVEGNRLFFDDSAPSE